MKKIEVHIITNRPKLDYFIDLWNGVNVPCSTTIKVLMTDCLEKTFSLNNNIRVEYIKQRTFPKTTYMNQAWARNELLCYANKNTDYILFYDDWQRPCEDILIEHLKYLEKGYIVCGQKIDCNENGESCKEDHRNKTNKVEECTYSWFWTANASAYYEDILNVNGFDCRFNGGSAGEDFDLCMRLQRLSNRKIIYNPNSISYHYAHDWINVKSPFGSKNINKKHKHNLSPFKYIPEYGHYGDWNLMKSDTFEFWWENHIKYWKCKICNEIGILDSVQVYYYNRDNNIIEVKNGLNRISSSQKEE